MRASLERLRGLDFEPSGPRFRTLLVRLERVLERILAHLERVLARAGPLKLLVRSLGAPERPERVLELLDLRFLDLSVRYPIALPR